MDRITGVAPDLLEPTRRFRRSKQAWATGDAVRHPVRAVGFHDQQSEVVVWSGATFVWVETRTRGQQNRHRVQRLVLIGEPNSPAVLNAIRIGDLALAQ